MRKATRDVVERDRPGKARVELRIDADLMQAVQKLAEQSGLSVNQLVGGIVRGSIAEAHVGYAAVAPDGEIFVVDDEPQAVWFGRVDDVEAHRGSADPVELWFSLNYRDSRAVESGRPGGKGTKGVGRE